MYRYVGKSLQLKAFSRGAKKVLPPPIVGLIRRMRSRLAGQIPVGLVSFGDLRRLSPIGHFGFDRGTPIDRYYIEDFLGRNAADIRGRVLEIGDDRYTRRFGGTRVERSDILSVEATNSKATLAGDLTRLETLPGSTFDCIILTQTLQYIFEVRAAIATLFRALKADGTLLLTVPSGGAAAVRRLLEESFERDTVTVDTYGNIFVATAFHFGVACEEVKSAELNASDQKFPVIVAARAVRAD